MNVCQRFGRISARAFCASLIVGTALAITSGIAAAEGLFDPASQADVRAAGPGQAGAVKRERLARLNAKELARIVPIGADHARNRLARARNLGKTVTIELFPGVTIEAERTDIEAPDEGGYVWAGEGKNRAGWVTLVIVDNEVTGQIQIRGQIYSISPVTGAVHRITEVDRSKVKQDFQLPIKFEEKSDAPAPLIDPKAKTTITVFIPHTENARKEMAGTVTQEKSRIQARANLAVKLANEAYTRSGVLIFLKRVGGAFEVNYNDRTSYGGMGTFTNFLGTLCDLAGFTPATNGSCINNNQTGKFKGVRDKRNAVKADLVALLRATHDFICGLAWNPDPPTADSHTSGYSATLSKVSDKCIETHAVAHEMGHNMGLLHDREQQLDDGGGPYPNSKYNFGFVSDPGLFYTIMAYFNQCGNESNAFDCDQAPFFSNPNKNFNGRPVGKANANNARRLNETRGTIAGYR